VVKVLKPITLIVVTLAVVGSLVNQDPAFANTATPIISLEKVKQVEGPDTKKQTLASKSSKKTEVRAYSVLTDEPILGTPEGNKAYAKQYMLDKKNWGNDQFKCVNSLWFHESRWIHTSENKYSGAYGIPQALPANKMASAGDDWKTNPATQIHWGVTYIKSRYGTPCGAYAHFVKYNWY
jgi:hypothetical protein